jgi:uncharacterized membrane protein
LLIHKAQHRSFTDVSFVHKCSFCRFDGAGYSISQTKEVLSSIASDCLIDDGYCVNAVEALWTPSERKEVLSKTDIIVDFPELIDL